MSLPVTPQNLTHVAPVAQTARTAPAQEKTRKFGFRDFLDIVNPLQHIPIVSTIYRQITGDEIKNTSRIAGGALFGGIAGAALGAVNAMFVHKTGEDMGQIAMNTAGIGSNKAAKTENIPVIEVRPSLQMAKKDEIIWDEPVKMVANAAPKTVPKPIETAVAKPDLSVAAAKLPEKPPELAVALPTPKHISELMNDAAAPQFQQPEKAAIPQNMMQALSKYESMQRLGKINEDAAELPVRRLATANRTPFAGAADIRRF